MDSFTRKTLNWLVFHRPAQPYPCKPKWDFKKRLWKKTRPFYIISQIYALYPLSTNTGTRFFPHSPLPPPERTDCPCVGLKKSAFKCNSDAFGTFCAKPLSWFKDPSPWVCWLAAHHSPLSLLPLPACLPAAHAHKYPRHIFYDDSNSHAYQVQSRNVFFHNFYKKRSNFTWPARMEFNSKTVPTLLIFDALLMVSMLGRGWCRGTLTVV